MPKLSEYVVYLFNMTLRGIYQEVALYEIIIFRINSHIIERFSRRLYDQ
jgi:hypothetical protein